MVALICFIIFGVIMIEWIKWIIYKIHSIMHDDEHSFYINNKKSTRRYSRKRINYHKRIRHPFKEYQTITRRSRWKKQPSCVDMKSFPKPNSLSCPKLALFEKEPIIINTETSCKSSCICIISFIICISLIIAFFPSFVWRFYNAMVFVSIIIGNCISAVMICFDDSDRVSIIIDAGEFNLGTISFPMSANATTNQLVSKFMEYTENKLRDHNFYVTFAAKAVSIADDIYLKDLNIHPDIQQNGGFIFTIHGGCIGGGKKTQTKNKQCKPLTEYFKPGSLLLFESTDEDDNTAFRVGRINFYDLTKFCILLFVFSVFRFVQKKSINMKFVFSTYICINIKIRLQFCPKIIIITIYLYIIIKYIVFLYLTYGQMKM